MTNRTLYYVDGTASPGGRTTNLGGGTLSSSGGTPDRGSGTPFRPVPAEFNHCLTVSNIRNLSTGHVWWPSGILCGRSETAELAAKMLRETAHSTASFVFKDINFVLSEY